MLTHPRRLVTAAALFAVAACTAIAQADAQNAAPLVLGPPRLGTAVMYRLTIVRGNPPAAPTDVQTLALRWKLGDKIVATTTVSGEPQSTPYVATRAPDGTLTLDNGNPDDPQGQRLAAAFALLNRITSFVAGAPAGAGTWNTTLTLQPPNPSPNGDAAAAPNAKKPSPIVLAVSAMRSSVSDGTTLTASGSSTRTVTHAAPGAGGGRGAGRGGGMGRRGGGFPGGGGGGGYPGGGDAGGAGGGMQIPAAPTKSNVTTKITVSAHFGLDGTLTSGKIAETITSADDPTTTTTRAWEVDRTTP